MISSYRGYNLAGVFQTPCLLLLITIPFTCGDKKISSNIIKSQNTMTKIVDRNLNQQKKN